MVLWALWTRLLNWGWSAVVPHLPYKIQSILTIQKTTLFQIACKGTTIDYSHAVQLIPCCDVEWILLKMGLCRMKYLGQYSSHYCPVCWGYRIHWLHLCRGVRPPSNECPGYDTKQSDGEVSVMLEPWGMQSTPSLPLLPDPLQPGMVAPDKALPMG